MNTRKSLLIIAFCVLAVTQLWPFTIGHHLNADDTLRHYFGLINNVAGLIAVTWQSAIEHGRLTYLIHVPLQIFANYFTDHQSFRIFVILIFFLSISAFCYHCKQLFGTKIGGLMLVLILSSMPLAYHHMPPTSYPLMISLPLLVLLIVRIALFNRISPFSSRSGPIVVGAVQTFCLLSSDYLLIIGCFILILTNIQLVFPKHLAPDNLHVERLIARQRLLTDFSSIGVAIASWIAFRALFHEPVSGNYLETGAEYGYLSILYFTLQHIINGTIFGLHSGLNPPHLGPIPVLNAVLSALAASIALSLLYRTASEPRGTTLMAAAAGTAFALSITLPVISIVKYQQWCAAGDCAYIDSRYAAWGVALSAAAALSLIRGSGRNRVRAYLISTTLISAVAAITAVNNYGVMKDMNRDTWTWQNAGLIKCALEYSLMESSSSRVALNDNDVTTLEKPPWHGWRSDYYTYWQEYLNTIGSDCDSAPKIQANEWINFGTESGEPEVFLLGWHDPEPWGRWSKGHRAHVLFQVPDSHRNRSDWTLEIGGAGFGPSSSVGLSFNGMEICKLELGREGGIIRIPLAVAPRDGNTVALTIYTPNAASPAMVGESQDDRILGLGVNRLQLLPDDDLASCEVISEG